MNEAGLAFGVFGKLPWAGDFVQHGLPARFVTPWDGWLSLMLAQSRAALAARWDDAYLLSPPWRFQLDAGLVGPTGWIGVLVSSVDRVGRHFPLTLAQEREAPACLSDPAAIDSGLDAFEAAALDLIAREQPIPETLERLKQSRIPPGPRLWRNPARPLTRLMVDPANARLSPAAADAASAGGASRWWHGRWNAHPAAAMSSHGLPDPALCAGFFDSDWAAHGWRIADLPAAS